MHAPTRTLYVMTYPHIGHFCPFMAISPSDHVQKKMAKKGIPEKNIKNVAQRS